ncbi:MAG: PAS domain-containing protein [Acidimicrobiales bacterium]
MIGNAVALLETLDLPAVATDEDGKITYWSNRATLLFGWSPEESVGRKCGELLGDFSAEASLTEMGVREGVTWSGHLPVCRSDGSTVIAKWTSNAVRDPAGEVIGRMVLFSEIFTDASEAKEPASVPPSSAEPLVRTGPTLSPTSRPDSVTQPLTVVLATDSLLVGDGLASFLADRADVEVVGRARGHREMTNLCRTIMPRAVIISIRNPDDDSMMTVTAARILREEWPEMGIVLISDCGSGFAIELLRHGASRLAYLLDEQLPSMDSVLIALREVAVGQSVIDPSIVDYLVKHHRVSIDDLSLRESVVLELMAEGLSNRAIAEEMNISIKSIEKCITVIFKNLDLNDQSKVDRRVAATLSFQRSKGISLYGAGAGPRSGGMERH